MVAIGLLAEGIAAALSGICLAATEGRVGQAESWLYALLFVMISRLSLFAVFWLRG
ncbi:MAG: hypothetical protein Q4G36_11755 [Paracoccus sp. (in: a-proteobacteria)]|nr:hypothetical protein [Paracoccus sp. (in: a-proteobacteria)]